MLERMQLAASCLLMLIAIVKLCSSSAIYHDYIVVGAGPGGLQLGYFLERAGRDYVILERAAQAGARARCDNVWSSVCCTKIQDVLHKIVCN